MLTGDGLAGDLMATGDGAVAVWLGNVVLGHLMAKIGERRCLVKGAAAGMRGSGRRFAAIRIRGIEHFVRASLVPHQTYFLAEATAGLAGSSHHLQHRLTSPGNRRGRIYTASLECESCGAAEDSIPCVSQPLSQKHKRAR